MARLPNLSQAFAHNKNNSICSAEWSHQRLGAISPGAQIRQALPYTILKAKNHIILTTHSLGSYVLSHTETLELRDTKYNILSFRSETTPDLKQSKSMQLYIAG